MSHQQVTRRYGKNERKEKKNKVKKKKKKEDRRKRSHNDLQTNKVIEYIRVPGVFVIRRKAISS